MSYSMQLPTIQSAEGQVGGRFGVCGQGPQGEGYLEARPALRLRFSSRHFRPRAQRGHVQLHPTANHTEHVHDHTNCAKRVTMTSIMRRGARGPRYAARAATLTGYGGCHMGSLHSLHCELHVEHTQTLSLAIALHQASRNGAASL